MIELLPTWTTVWLALSLAIGLAVGLGLLGLAARTRQWPERALGAFGVAVSIGNLGTIAALRLESLAGAFYPPEFYRRRYGEPAAQGMVVE